MGNKQRKVKVPSLKESDIEFLLKYTSLSQSEIQVWHKRFLTQCDKNQMYEKFRLDSLLNRIPPIGNSSLFCKQIFIAFDTQENKVPFNIFLFAISMKLEGEPEKKLPMIFKMFDIHKCGKLGIESIEAAIRTLYELFGVRVQNGSDSIEEKATKIMIRYDTQHKYYLNESQFVDGFSNDATIRKLLEANLKVNTV